MKNSGDKPQEPPTSEIVRIAYSQSEAIAKSNGSGEPPKAPANGLACASRIMKLPLIASINTSITDAYASVKTSHSTVESILKSTEDGLAEGAKIVSPVTSMIGETLEEPMRSIDTVICDGLDYLEEKVPAVKLPPGEICDSVGEYIRNVSDTVKKHSSELYVDVKVRIDDIARAIEAPTTEKKDGSAKDPKSSD